MDWIIIVVTLVLVAAYMSLRRKGQIPEDAAIAYLKEGAVVVDVRSPAEFSTGHLKGAINMPLPQIETLIVNRVNNREKVVLLHCQSGMRSGVAKKKLEGLGYTRAYNLGSYARAARILNRA